MWVGTTAFSNSLARFNGFEFSSPGSLAKPPGAGFTSLTAGQDGRLWVSVAAGAGSLFLWQGEKMTSIETPLPAPPVYRGITLFEDRERNLWIGGNGLLVRSPDGHIRDLSAAVKGFGDIRQVTEDRQGVIWMASSNGLVRCRGGAFDQPYPLTTVACSVLASRSGSLWVGSDQYPSLIQVTPAGQLIRYGENEGMDSRGIWTMCEDLDTNLWIGSYAGLYCARAGRVRRVEETNLKTGFISSLLCDREGSLWVGTADGLYHIQDNPIEHFGATDGLGPVSSLSLGLGGIWATVFSQGAYLYQDQTWSHVKLNTDNTFSDGQILEAADGDLWLDQQSSTTAGFIYRIHGQQTERMMAIAGHAYLYDDGRRVWTLTATNALCFQAGKLAPQGEAWAPLDITFVLTNRDHGLLVGSTWGLCRWDGRLEPWLGFDRNFPGTRINGLQWEGDALWVVSDQAVARHQNGRWQTLDSRAGLAETGGINSVLLAENNLWLGCENGLFRVDRNELDDALRGGGLRVTLHQYGKAQGLHSSYLGSSGLWSKGVAMGPDGRLWFASMSGLEVVDIRRLQNSNPPPVVVESVLLDQQPVAGLAAGTNGSFTVPAGARSVEIHYAALTYVAPGEAAYRYRLEGLDSGWVNAGNTRVARFTKLPPGAYKFQVQACDAAGVWNLQGAGLRFVQIPFFYQTRTFYFLCLIFGMIVFLLVAALAAAIAHGVSTRRMRRKMAALEAQQAMDRERARIARDIHDDIGSTLTQIVMLSELASREPEQTYAPDGHLSGIRSAAREITRRLDEIVWAINPRNDTLDALVSYISKLATDQARAAGMHCRLDLPPALPACTIKGAMRHNLFLACKESVHNAIKHARASQLQLRLTLDEENIQIEISDNGMGLPDPLPKQDGDGLLNLKERLRASGGSCDFISIPGQGTAIRFRLPRPAQEKSLSTK